MKYRSIATLLLAFWSLSLFWPPSPAYSQQAVVRAVLFYSPSCGHCHYVLTEVLPPLAQKYGDQLEIIAINVETEQGQMFFLPAVEMFGNESGGVPMLVVGDHALVGSLEIPERFPGLIEEYLAQGGVDWPAIPGLAEAIQAAQMAQSTQTASNAESTPAVAETAETQETMGASAEASTLLLDRLARDPAGNALSIVVLLGMVAVGVGAVVNIQRPIPASRVHRWQWAIPALCLAGIAVAGYMAYVETAQVEAVCGPVGDCNTVQQSAFARLFGVLPIGILGIIGYGLILLAWLVGRYGRGRISDLAWLALLGMTSFGLLFSIYLTFLEPFVIGATCAWCLTSAVLMTALFWLSLAPGKSAWVHL